MTAQNSPARRLARRTPPCPPSSLHPALAPLPSHPGPRPPRPPRGSRTRPPDAAPHTGQVMGLWGQT